MIKNSSDIKRVKEILEEKGLRVTQQRINIYYALMSSKDHPTAEIIYSDLKAENPSLSLATVYKTLDTLYKQGLVKKIKTEEDSVHYDADLNSHNHLIDLKSNEIRDYDDPDFNDVLKEYFRNAKIKDFEIEDIRVKIYGKFNVNK